ncbi:MAG: hemerythrin domain-containing protein, partial [Blastococcus sp.]
MTTAVLTRPALPVIPAPRVSIEVLPRRTAAVGYQRVLHQMVRREFRLLAELASWATPDDAQRTEELTQHADLMSRVLLQHHATERAQLWPALFRHLPVTEQDAARKVIAEWTGRAALLDHSLRDLSTVARQWAVAQTLPARNAFARACTRLADQVDAHLSAEERDLHPLLARYLTAAEWTAVSRAATTPLSGREQMIVLGLALEDACAIDRARLLAGLSPAARTAWRVVGHRNF